VDIDETHLVYACEMYVDEPARPAYRYNNKSFSVSDEFLVLSSNLETRRHRNKLLFNNVAGQHFSMNVSIMFGTLFRVNLNSLNAFESTIKLNFSEFIICSQMLLSWRVEMYRQQFSVHDRVVRSLVSRCFLVLIYTSLFTITGRK